MTNISGPGIEFNYSIRIIPRLSTPPTAYNEQVLEMNDADHIKATHFVSGVSLFYYFAKQAWSCEG